MIQRWDREDHKRFSVVRALPHKFAADPAITLFDTLVEDAVLPDRGDIWPVLTPLYFDDVVGGWKVWTNGVSIEGFLLGATGTSYNLFADNRTGRLQMFQTEEVLGLIMIKGTVHAEDVYLPPGENTTDLYAALRSTLREDGIDVDMLDNVH